MISKASPNLVYNARSDDGSIGGEMNVIDEPEDR